MSGGRIIVRPNKDFIGNPLSNIIVGNTVLYGAIAGEAFFNGVAGERFAVRNSGAATVVEGTGDHCCEYMTGGTVVVLGTTGRNFAAGMSGGIAYVYDMDGDFHKKCNMAMVSLESVLSSSEQTLIVDRAVWHSVLRGGQVESDEVILKKLIERHLSYTNSHQARTILNEWNNSRSKFIKVFPLEYKRALNELAATANPKSKVTIAA
jgi:glutamate synthase (NADPH/NADH) large chain